MRYAMVSNSYCAEMSQYCILKVLPKSKINKKIKKSKIIWNVIFVSQLREQASGLEYSNTGLDAHRDKTPIASFFPQIWRDKHACTFDDMYNGVAL